MKQCICCGGSKLELNPVLWQSLIDEWQISPFEVEYINRQQGFHCIQCGSNLRSMALAKALMQYYEFYGFLKDFVKDSRFEFIKILEINEAGSLTQFLRYLPNHKLEVYPAIDLMNIHYFDDMYDTVIHSDVLEHIPYPLRALSECRRVLRKSGACFFTVPMIVDRLTRQREGLVPSYHGTPEQKANDLLVYTEYGCDTWQHLIKAGFSEVRLFSLDYPAAHAWVGVKDSD